MIYYIKNKQDIPDIIIDHLVIGVFDALHHGHQKLFHNCKRTTILTFNKALNKTKTLYDLSTRLTQLQNYFRPINIIVWDLEQFNISALEFIEYTKKWQIQSCTVGSDFKFGNDQKNALFLKQYINNVEIIDRLEDQLATRHIKNLVINGAIEEANKLLLEKYYYVGKVIKDQQQARLLGYPTANFMINDDHVIPENGIYISRTILKNNVYDSVTFIGEPKVILDNHKHFESHLLNYHGPEFYDETIKVIFYKKIGDVQTFPNINMLKQSIQRQVNEVKEFFKK